jgi:hypothetical protein
LSIGKKLKRIKTEVLRKKGVVGTQCCGSEMFIPDPGSEFFPSRIPDPIFFHPGSRIRIKELKYFNQKKWFLSTQKYDPGFSSRIRTPDPDFLPIADPGVKKAPDPGTGSATLWERFKNCVD